MTTQIKYTLCLKWEHRHRIAFILELEDSDKTIADYGTKGGRGVLTVRAVSRCFALFRGCLSLAFRSSSQ